MSITLQLTGITPGGDAIGRHEGMVLFVPFGLPGEKVEVDIVEKRRSFARGRIVRVLEAATERIEPRCAHFGLCGGCQWQQIDYAAQLRFKQMIVAEQLTRIGKIIDPPVDNCIPSPTHYGYRNHARLAIAPSGRLGYRAAASHSVVEVEECPILEKELEAQLAAHQVNRFTHQKRKETETFEIRWQTATLQIGNHEYWVSPTSFFQANSAVAATMVDLVLAALQLDGSQSVLDLYCGAGLFTLPIAEQAARVVGIESNPSATADARRNLAELNHQRAGCCEIVAAPVADGLQHKSVTGARWDAIVLDPPRAGVDEKALQRIVAVRAPLIVYVSCDPATLARDLQQLIAAGYRLISAQPLDMFPQTFHVETICVLRNQFFE